ncbi:MAG: hypothetical protein A2W91_07305 [Bacteroidetes bacterium GWF2_38_335]|nr:MAG: hypothetical protein A2W91_07305 [Bacteroidetes bacterium GWF2_38_335]OFY77135.1 MAG: hypothetical protein A2281_14540 [Bacteroidetes bacterium RIFOXYA12_FULL_38_20]HBS85026.1 hypothetical protein [Bacteroidales bacterium]
MLHKETVDPKTLELIIKLQSKTYLKDFYLVGGTALALKIGHRKSIDIDLFSNFDFDTEELLENLSSDFSFHLFFSAKNTIKGSIDNVQIDILAHRYPYVCEPKTIDQISMLSVPDIIAMKLNAITVSGQRVKDFIDLYYLLYDYSVEEMISYYKQKYALFNEVNVLKSMTWFDDVDTNEWPIMIKDNNLKWTQVKKNINSHVSKYLKKQF